MSFSQKRSASLRRLGSIRSYGSIVLLGLLTLAGWASKPAPISNAGIAKVLGDDTAKLQAAAPARTDQRQEQFRQIRPENFDLNRYPVTNANEKHWRNLLWTTALVEPQDPFVAAAIEQILAMMLRSGLTDSQMRTVDMATKVGTQLYLSHPTDYASVGQRFAQAIAGSPDPEWVAVSLSGLAKVGIPAAQLQQFTAQALRRFPNGSSNVSLQTTLREITNPPTSAPPLRDLLNWTIAPKQLHLYVLCQPDRYVLCQTVLKDRDGQFVRQPSGELWSVPLLLRSLHNLGWNFVRGQTPQGIYRVEGSIPQPDDEFFRAYGQFSLVNLFIPFENGAKQFLPGRNGTFKGSMQDYQALLPPSWRNYFPIQQSYWAGKVGRSEFRIHGTGDSPEFFSGKGKNPDSYNWNPTIGCLSALELYNEQGQLIEADMPKLLNALESVGGKKFTGYLVVADLPSGSGQPIALNDIESAIGSRSSKLKSAPKAASRKTAATVQKPSLIAAAPGRPLLPSTPSRDLPTPIAPSSPPAKPDDFNPVQKPLPIAY